MKRGSILSGILHGTVAALLVFGVPSFIILTDEEEEEFEEEVRPDVIIEKREEIIPLEEGEDLESSDILAPSPEEWAEPGVTPTEALAAPFESDDPVEVTSNIDRSDITTSATEEDRRPGDISSEFEATSFESEPVPIGEGRTEPDANPAADDTQPAEGAPETVASPASRPGTSEERAKPVEAAAETETAQASVTLPASPELTTDETGAPPPPSQDEPGDQPGLPEERPEGDKLGAAPVVTAEAVITFDIVVEEAQEDIADAGVTGIGNIVEEELPAPETAMDQGSAADQDASFFDDEFLLEEPPQTLEELGELIERLLAETLTPLDPDDASTARFAEEMETLARGGYVEAQYVLGELYQHGIGVEEDAAEAAKWYRSAAEQRYIAAQVRYGYMSALGDGAPKDLVQAHLWWSLAAEDNELIAARARDLIAEAMTNAELFDSEKEALQTRQIWSNWKRFAKLNFPDIDLHLIAAAKAGEIETVKRLLDQGADVNAADERGYTALLWTAISSQSDIAVALLARGANPNVQDRNGKSVLMWAADNGDEATVKALLRKDIEVNARDEFGETALINASWSGRTRIAEVLLRKGAAIDLRDDYGATALMWTAINGHMRATELLVAHGAVIDIKDSEGLTALMRAAWNNFPQVVAYLLDYGANPTVQDEKGRTALDLAESENNDRVVRLLRDALQRQAS